MSLFSQRNSYSPVRVEIQLESLDEKSRIQLWNLMYKHFIAIYIRFDVEYNLNYFARTIWNDFQYKSASMSPHSIEQYHEELYSFFMRKEWYWIFDFIEFILNLQNLYHTIKDEIIFDCNQILEKELSAYRIVNRQFVQITNEIEIKTIETAINISKEGVKLHLTRSLELLSDRQNPDYRNSIKEAISALEAFCIEVTGDQKATLGEALRHPTLKDVFHGSLLKGFSNIYGFTSNAEGIRHALMDEPTLKQEDAIFMLVSCSAFVNYLRSKL